MQKESPESGNDNEKRSEAPSSSFFNNRIGFQGMLYMHVVKSFHPECTLLDLYQQLKVI